MWRYPFGSTRYINLFEPFHFFTACDQLVVLIGATHISLLLQEYNQGSGRKENKRTKRLGLTQVQKESYVTLYMCRLTLVWTLANFHKATGMPTHLDSIFFHWSGPSLMPTRLSAVPCRLLLSVVPRQLPTSQSLCLTLWLASPHHFRSRWDCGSKTLCLVSHQNRQRNRLLGGPPT